MTKRHRPDVLTAGDYLVRNPDGQDDQMAAARWQFIEAVAREVPAFLERLRDQVYPAYARLANVNSAYWVMGWKFETWQLVSDGDNRLTPILVAWARGFNVEGEQWILEGALQTLAHWHRFPRLPAASDIRGFRPWVAVPGLISSRVHRFEFSHEGWDPSFMRFAGWRTNVRKRFEEAIGAHERQMRELARDLGAFRAAFKFSAEHFAWLALYQCGHLSLDAILRRAPNVVDKTTISKGIHSAASLAAITVRPKGRKLKKR
jgi:hypothetical protein